MFTSRIECYQKLFFHTMLNFSIEAVVFSLNPRNFLKVWRQCTYVDVCIIMVNIYKK